MNNKESFTKPPDPLEEQRTILDEIHKQQRVTLDKTGITEKIREKLDAKPESNIGKLFPAAISVPISGSQEYVTRYQIGIKRHFIGDIDRLPHTETRFVSIADTFHGILMPANGFSNDDAENVIKMVDSLRDARKNGLIPNLNPECTAIVESKKY